MNPALPPKPGHPGLLFCSRDDLLNNKGSSTAVFVKKDAKKNLWAYMGEYEFEVCEEALKGVWFGGMPKEVCIWSSSESD